MEPFSLILVGLALFFVFKLISVLGTRTGHEPPRDMDAARRADRPDGEETRAHRDRADETDAGADKPVRALPEVSPAASPIRAVDPTFDERDFLEGAKAAYEMIVEAFAAGDLKSVRRYIASTVYEAFRLAVQEREARGARMELKFVGVESARIEHARVEGDSIFAKVAFASNQVRATYDASGGVVDGDPARVDLVRDAWTFSRSIKSSDPNWTLVATGA